MSRLIDTNVFVDSSRNIKSAQDFLKAESPPKCSIITKAEIVQGARNKKEVKVIRGLLKDIRTFPLSEEIGIKMLSLMGKYCLSHGLEIPDALIAATAIKENLALVTENTKHFSFINELKIIDWGKLKKLDDDAFDKKLARLN